MTNAKVTVKPKVAAIITEYRHNSHAEVIIGRLFGHLGYEPQVEVASLYIDQFPENDMSRKEAANVGIPICDSIYEAIMAVGREQISGVFIIGEHGDYPLSRNGQKQYPRRRFLEEVLLTLDEIKVKVPIFFDKHLSWNIDDALWMYNALKEREIPFLGGSSIPHVSLVPRLQQSSLQNPKEMLAVSYGEVESYGYHALEALQSLAEKRNGGESGVKSVRAIEGEQVWEEMEQGLWSESLMLLALRNYPKPMEGHPRSRGNNAALMTIEYVDGLIAHVIHLPSEVEQWSVAWTDVEGFQHTVRFDSDLDRPFGHFGILTKLVEEMIISGKSAVPVERSFLTTGMIHYVMESLHHRQKIDTPVLQIAY